MRRLPNHNIQRRRASQSRRFLWIDKERGVIPLLRQDSRIHFRSEYDESGPSAIVPVDGRKVES
jgi:hypothetical protein